MQTWLTGLNETGYDHFPICMNSLLTYIVIHSHLTYAYSKARPTRLHKLRALRSLSCWFQEKGTDNARAHTKAPAIKKKIKKKKISLLTVQ
jgi:hypothetical protein